MPFLSLYLSMRKYYQISFKPIALQATKNYLETHKKFEIEIIIFLGRYKVLKMEIFKIIERIMRKKGQKKFPKAKKILKIDKI